MFQHSLELMCVKDDKDHQKWPAIEKTYPVFEDGWGLICKCIISVADCIVCIARRITSKRSTMGRFNRDRNSSPRCKLAMAKRELWLTPFEEWRKWSESQAVSASAATAAAAAAIEVRDYLCWLNRTYSFSVSPAETAEVKKIRDLNKNLQQR